MLIPLLRGSHALWRHFLLCLLLLATPALADDGWEDEDDGDDDLGFAETTASESPVNTDSPIRLRGHLKQRFGVWLERSSSESVSTVRTTADLEVRVKRGFFRSVLGGRTQLDPIYQFADRGYDQPTRDTYGRRVFLQDAYVAFAPPQLELRVGHQSVAWGEGDALSPADVVTPYDQREIGLADIDEIRRPRLLSKLSVFEGAHRAELIVAHEAYYGERPTPRSEYSPLRATLVDDPVLSALLGDKALSFRSSQRGYDIAHWDYFARWVFNGSGFDLGFSAAYLRDRQGIIALPNAANLVSETVHIPLEHRRFLHFASTGAYAVDDWLLKWELTLACDEPLNTGDLNANPPQVGSDTMDRITPMLSLGYAGLPQLTLGVEFQKPTVLQGPSNALFPADMLIVSSRAIGSYLRERLRIVGVVTTFGVRGQYGRLFRFESTYELGDGLRAMLTYIHYGTGAQNQLGPLTGLDVHDQVLVHLRWDFQY